MHTVLGAGVVSLIGGGAMMISDANDQAYRVAGGCAVVFGAIDAVIALTSLRGIARDARTWDAERPGRGNAARLQQARARWLAAERSEGVAYSLNLGLDVAYLSSGLTAVLASQLGVEQPPQFPSGAGASQQAGTIGAWWASLGLKVEVQRLQVRCVVVKVDMEPFLPPKNGSPVSKVTPGSRPILRKPVAS